MATGRRSLRLRAVAGWGLPLLVLFAASGCGSGEEAGPPPGPSAAAPKSGPVTKPSGARLDPGSEQQALNEERGG